jgi:hypothetical protein
MTQSNLQTISIVQFKNHKVASSTGSSVERKLPTPSKDPPLEFIILSFDYEANFEKTKTLGDYVRGHGYPVNRGKLH